ncbi:hypothetical protein [Nitrosarchaeum koreense]|uniref:Divergent AAA domain family n=1 Tax=Nitrosarchaeum koreense MY1 TaxID=1001994 RepID=F9CVG6_9ARCH|nr:hypothetical protein [Nitrosarchaeum koreense]EGP93268.1 Divergent AAA domain family [Nitrosarchaeum koreense MY1]
MEKKPFEQFLEFRHLFNPESEDFGLNHNSENLHDETNSESKAKVPFVLFSSCPTDLMEINVKDSSHIQWIKENSNITIQEYEINYLRVSKTHFDIDSLILNDDFNDRVRQYVEFYENGFIEQGFAFPMIYGNRKDDPYGVSLGRITIAFWCFLYFLKKYYTKLGFSGNIDLRIIVRNSDVLSLTGFKGKINENRIWGGIYDDSSNHNVTKTYHRNILIKKEVSLNGLTDYKIEEIVKLFSNKIANAYDLDFARCYNFDGTFSFENYVDYNNH